MPGLLYHWTLVFSMVSTEHNHSSDADGLRAESGVVCGQCIIIFIIIISIIPPQPEGSAPTRRGPEEREKGTPTYTHTQSQQPSLLNRLPHSQKPLSLFSFSFPPSVFRLFPTTLSLTRTQTTISCPFFTLATTTVGIGRRSLWRPMGVRDRRVFGRSALAGCAEYRHWDDRRGPFGAGCHCQCGAVRMSWTFPLSLILTGGGGRGAASAVPCAWKTLLVCSDLKA